jgi:hypothetical protein
MAVALCNSKEDNGCYMDEYTEQPLNEEPDDVPSNQPGYRMQAFPAPAPIKKSHKKLWLTLVIILAVAGLGYGAWTFFGKKKPSTQSNTNNTQTATQQTETITKDVADADGTKEYENGFLGVDLTYPNTWTATEGINGESVRLESPEFSFDTTDKGPVTGNFRIYIRKGARTIDGKYIGRGVAIQPSEKLKYTDPAPGQRTETNLSLFGLDDTENFAFFMIAGNFELKKGDTLGPNYGKEAETYIIAGGFSSKEFKDDLQTYSVPPDYLKTSNAYKQVVEILKSLKLH